MGRALDNAMLNVGLKTEAKGWLPNSTIVALVGR